jgi:hypothetical protein
LLLFTNNNGGTARHIQSLVIGSVILIAAVITLALGVIADLIRINRTLIEDSLEQDKRARFARPDIDVDIINEEVLRREWVTGPAGS